MRGQEAGLARGTKVGLPNNSQPSVEYIERVVQPKFREYDRLAELFKKLNDNAVTKQQLANVMNLETVFRLEPLTLSPTADQFNALLAETRKLAETLIMIQNIVRNQ